MCFIPRTVIEIPESFGQDTGWARGLADLCQTSAYVLVRAPGSGKTTAFRREADATGARFLTARDLICLDLERWKSGVLFVDGLDEMRAGSSDARRPLDL